MTETVLVVGSTGNIGCSAVKAALTSGRNVIAVVRNQVSADKLRRFIGSSEGITFAEADVTSDYGVKGVVDRVRAGALPAFQHVWCSGTSHSPGSSGACPLEKRRLLTSSEVAGDVLMDKLSDLTPEVYNENMRRAGHSGFCKSFHLCFRNLAIFL